MTKATRKAKATGSHYTPADMAQLLSERLVGMMAGMRGPLRVLDPACGDGNLLVAIAAAMPEHIRERATLIGVEQDDDAFHALQSRRAEFSACEIHLIQGDFLEFRDEGDSCSAGQLMDAVDVIIANPPYVRTQVLGAKRAQRLAAAFGLSGRVDLYQAFLVAMARRLRPGGVMGVITSNRFLTTRGGMATRRFLRNSFDLIEVIDLGDTRPFEAAVLPALVFASRRVTGSAVVDQSSFARIYASADEPDSEVEQAASVFECLRQPRSGKYRINGSIYCVAADRFAIPGDDARPWTMLTSAESKWLEAVNSASECRVGDVAKVRVGVKTTADSVFVRRDWHELPPEIRPEARHLRTLLSQEDAAKWRPLPNHAAPKRVLYTHEAANGRRRPIFFDESSSTWRYLVAHRQRLESRQYVIDAGRRWYEIWVPQDPEAWRLRKIVFPDISPDARFFLDENGCIVDGNSYWITTNDPGDEDLLFLILAVANSRMMSRYHDLAFPNRLYARRRRYLTQYVCEYPLPPRSHPASRAIPGLVLKMVTGELSPAVEQGVAAEIDEQVTAAFGIATVPV